jgi:small subunit ribosomal protein S1
MVASDDEGFAALFAASEAEQKRSRPIAAGDLVRGRVIAVGATSAFVAVGGKAEGMIDLAEFRDSATGEVTLKEGDEIEATVVDDGASSGSIILKRVAGRGGHVPGELEQAFANGIPIEGVVTGENKGGFDVQLGSVRAFCPGSQIDRRRTEGAQYVGQRFSFRITKLDPRGRNVVY